MIKRFISLTVAVALISGFLLQGTVMATTVNYNNVISDTVFDASNTMSAAQIDAFLNTFSQSCISTNNGFAAPDVLGYNPTDSFIYGNDVSAGTIIYHAAQAYGINPRVILTTLQKEQGLVKGDGPNIVRPSNDQTDCGALAISASMGYNCPDNINLTDYSGFELYAHNGKKITSVTQTCVENAAYVGFSRQVINAAWLFTFDRHRAEGLNNWYINKTNWDNSDDLQFCYVPNSDGQGQWMADSQGAKAYRCPDATSHPNDPYVAYSGQYVIDGTVVTMQNGATAALFDYTPHLHGQELFFNIFTGWFGSTQIAVNYISLDVPRWMQTKTDIYKKDPATGLDIDSVIPAGTQIYFSSKTSMGGKMYLRSQDDTNHGLNKTILYSDLEEVPMTYTDLQQPRWLKITMNLQKVDPQTDEVLPYVIPSGTEAYFPSKITIGGVQYLRTQMDTDLNRQTGIPFYVLANADIQYQDMQVPRWMQAKTDTHVYDIRHSLKPLSTISASTQQHFDHKITVNGTTYLYNGLPSSSDDFLGTPLSDLEEQPLTYISLQAPRYMLTKDNVYKRDPLTGQTIGVSLPLNTQIYFDTKIQVNGKWYLRTRSDSTGNIKRGILWSDLSNTPAGFVPLQFIGLEVPRYMVTKSDLHMIDPSTNESVGDLIPAGTKFYFNTKVLVDDTWYLRTDYNSRYGIDWTIPWSDLTNAE